MQFHLSTLFLIFFMVAASLALCGSVGIWISVTIFLAALLLNRMESLFYAISFSIFILFFGIGFPILLPAIPGAREAARRAACINNLKQIGHGIHNYHDANKHFPSANICDKDGKPLFSWRLGILLAMIDGPDYNALRKNEPWNSPYNTKILSQDFPEYKCPSANLYLNDLSNNYVAIIGPGTAWREYGPIKLSDLPDRGSFTVMCVEVVNSGVHWAEPRDLTVDEALEGLKTGKGLRISTAHPSVVNVLFADGAVRSLPAKMPISVWKKLLAGEITDLDNIEKMIDPSAPDMVDVSIHPPEPGNWLIILGIIVWLFSVVLLFRRAIKSRPKPFV